MSDEQYPLHLRGKRPEELFFSRRTPPWPMKNGDSKKWCADLETLSRISGIADEAILES